MRNDLAARSRELALTFTGWPSVTGTPGEAALPQKLAGLLQGFDRVWTEAIPGDAFGRSNVFALKRGRGRKAIVLTGHFDVVPIDDYGDLRDSAFSPEALRLQLIARLKQSGAFPKALADFESGLFLPGRGLLDMKAGLAAGLAAAETFSGNGNLLFVAVSDEEERSAGMRAASPRLAELARELDLDIGLVINLDAISDQGDGSAGQVVSLGSIGKQLLTAYAVGKETHACYPEDGINAAYLAAELVAEFERAPELAEQSGAERAAPPVALHAKDLKSGYNVTTPGSAWVYWNTLQHRRSGAEVLQIGQALATRAMQRASQKLGCEIAVTTYAEIARRLDSNLLAARAHEIAALRALDFPERAKLMTEFACAKAGIGGPAIVMGFGSIPYPAVSLGSESLGATISAVAQRHGCGTIRYFPGISDMSFVGEAAGDLSVVAANTPIWGTSFNLPDPAALPCINIGPWGRDYHHWLERLYTPYAFDVLPVLLANVVTATLDGN